MAKKRIAVELYERDANGNLSPVLVDFETGEQVLENAKSDYQIADSTDLQAMELLGELPSELDDVNDTGSGVTLPNAQERLVPSGERRFGEGGERGKSTKGGKGFKRDATNNFGYIGGTGLVGKAAGFIPGPVGMIATAANAGVALNDAAARNAAREYARTTDIPKTDQSIGDRIKQGFNDFLGLSGTDVIGQVTTSKGVTHHVDMKGVGGLSPVEARRHVDVSQSYTDDAPNVAAQATRNAKSTLHPELSNLAPSGYAKALGKAPKEKTKTPGTATTETNELGVTTTKAAAAHRELPSRPNPASPDITDKVREAVANVAGPNATVTFTSGTEDEGKQHGSNRHKTGKATDFSVQIDGRTLDAKNPRDAQMMKAIGEEASNLGVEGIGVGTGYMGGTHMHMDTVSPSEYSAGQDSAWGDLGNQWQGDFADAKQGLKSSTNVTPTARPDNTVTSTAPAKSFNTVRPDFAPQALANAPQVAAAPNTVRPDFAPAGLAKAPGVPTPTSRPTISQTVRPDYAPTGLAKAPGDPFGGAQVAGQTSVGPSNVPTPTARPTDMAPVGAAPTQNARKEAFYKEQREYAKAAGLTGVAADVAIAQAGLETGYGAHAPNNNYHGIKGGTGYKGKVASFSTMEQGTTGLAKTTAAFRSYENPIDSYKDWAKQIERNWSGVLKATNFDEAVGALQDQGRLGAYASDENYKDKLSPYYSEVAQYAPDTWAKTPTTQKAHAFGLYAESYFDKAMKTADAVAAAAKSYGAQMNTAGPVGGTGFGGPSISGGANRPASGGMSPTGNMGRGDTPSSGRASMGGATNSPGEGNRGVGGSRYGGGSSFGGAKAGGSTSSGNMGRSDTPSSGRSTSSSFGGSKASGSTSTGNMGRSDTPSSGRSTGSSIGGTSKDKSDSHAGRAGF